MALSADRNTLQMGDGIPKRMSYPQKGSTTIYKGSLVALDSSGYAKPAISGTALLVVGRAAQHQVNSGSSGSLSIEVEQGVFKWAVNGTAVTAANIGSLCYAYDDQTVTLSSTSASVAGTIYGFDADGGCYVQSGLSAPVDGTATAAVATDLAQHIVDLAATTTGHGAGLIGIYDTAGYFDGATVEAALIELTEEPLFSYSSQVTLATVANSDVVAAFKPGFKCKIISAQFTPTIAVSTSAKAATLTVKINTTAVTGGVMALTSANCNTKGTQVAGTTVTAANAVIATDTVNVVASSVTAFTEGEGMINILFGRA